MVGLGPVVEVVRPGRPVSGPRLETSGARWTEPRRFFRVHAPAFPAHRPRSPPMVGARGDRPDAAGGRARRDHRQRGPAPGPARTGAERHRAAVGHHRLRPGVRRAAAARRTRRRLLGAQAQLHGRDARVRRRLRVGRSRAERDRADRGARPAGRLRGAAGTRGTRAADGHIPGRARARNGVRGLRHRQPAPAPRWALRSAAS